MKHEIPKKVFSWFLVILVFAASFLSPLTVMASINTNNLQEAANIRYLVKIADDCIGGAENSAIASLTTNVDTPGRASLKDYYKLKLNYVKSGSTYADRITLYDSYLEQKGQGEYQDGMVWCTEINDKYNIIPTLLDKLSLNNDSEYSNIICGRNNEGGLFKIKMGYIAEDLLSKDTTNWPNGIPAIDQEGYVTNCKEALEDIKYYLSSGEQLDSSRPFGARFILNTNFRFSDYLKDYLDRYGFSSGVLFLANKYLNFNSSCDFDYKTKEQYESAVKHGAAEQYAIYNPIGLETEYVTLKSPERTIYVNFPEWNYKLTEHLDVVETYTCKTLAENLEPNDQLVEDLIKDIDRLKYEQIKSCYDTAQQNIKNLKTAKGNLESIKNFAIALRQAAEGVYESKNYGGGFVSDEELHWTKAMDASAKKISGNNTTPTSVQGFIDQAKSFETEVHNYYKNQQSKDPTDEEKEAFKGKIDNYIANLDAFDKQIIQKAKESIDKIPNISLESASIYGPVMEGQSEYHDKVEGFYEFNDEGVLVCTITDDVLKGIKREFENIVGVQLSFTEYTPPINSNNDNPDAISADCYSAGLDSMSWILCPVINNTSQAVDGIEQILRNWLQIDTNKVFRDQTYTAWEVFRNIANVVIIIIFLVVIFSQLTGVGIDNYGIKKLLPRLIVISILINLSYIICELAVDLSNILGVGLDNMFKGIGTAIRGDAGGVQETVSSIVAGLFGALAGAGAISGTVIAAISIGSGGGVMLVISLVLVLLTALVAVLMFFVMLGARMIIVIIFTVIAPVAFALYILPNTQNLFKKWWKIFQAALVVFPICGALYGASFIIKAIIFGGGEIDFIWGLIAVCAPFLPFLLLPTLLKSTLAGLGALGGTLTMLGNGLRRGLSKGNETFRNTDAYKERAQLAKENAAAARAQRIHNRLSGRTNLSEKQRERLRRADDTVLAHNKRLSENSRRTTSDAYFNAMLQKQEIEGKAEEDTISRYNDANYRAARMQSLEDEAMNRRIADQQALIMAGLEYEDSGGKKRVNANNLQSVSDYYKYLLEQVADSNRSKEERATSMEKVKAVQNILSGTDKGRGYVQQNIEDAIRNNRTMGLSEAASHLFVNYGDKYKAANRGAHAMISDLATSQTDADGNLVSTAVSSIQSKLNGANGNEYSMAGIDKYTAESLASADEEAIDRLVNAYGLGQPGDQLGDVTDTTSKAYKIASTAYSAMNNPNISTKLKPEVKDKLEKLVRGYTPSVTPEDTHRAKIETQNQAMIDAQYQNFQVNHQIYAERVGRNAITGTYVAPNGYLADPTRPGIYRDSNGHTYDANTNKFS